MTLNHSRLAATAGPANPCRFLIGHFSKPFFLLLTTCWLLAGGLFAQTTWDGSASSDWFDTDNWSAGIPDPTDDVTIPNANNKPVIGAGTVAVAKSVRITVAAAQLTISSTASLAINGSTGFALENFGTLDNSGTIQIGNVSSVANRGIVHRNGGTLNNKPGGLIQIDRTSAAEAFYSTGIVNNEGSIQIGSNAAVTGRGIRMESNTFNNKPGASIKIDQISIHAIDIANTGAPAPIFNNEGLIQIGSQADVGGYGIVNRVGCTVNNKTGGDISMNRVAGCIYNNGIFTNAALITIDNETRKAQDGILNDGSGNFTNNATGIISIQKTWGNGIWNNFGSVTNAGKITIRDIYNNVFKDYSTGILNYGTFSSTSGAEIHLDLVGGGIISTSSFTNAGIIRMGENAPLSAMGILNLQAGGVFNNNAGGDISIKQTEKEAVRNDAPSSFFNNTCAQLAIFGKLSNSGAFTNSGLFRVNGTAHAHVNTALTNNGVIEYIQGANIIPNVTNNDVVVKPITGECTLPNILALGGMNSFTIGTTWYTDPALTIPAGTYTQATNTFSFNQSVEGTYTLYFAVSDGANGCTRTVSILLTYDDVTRPTIACPSNQAKAADAGLCTAVVNYTTPIISDNCAIGGVAILSGPASGQPFPKGQTTVVWKATDAVGLTKTCSFRVTVNDTQAPTFTLCPSSQSVSTDAGLCTAAVTYATPTAADNCTPPPTVVKQSGLASGSNFPKGASVVVWKATDGTGLTKTCSFTVTVTDAQLPTITCPSNIAVTGSGPSCNAVVVYASPTVTDNCAITSNYLLSGLASGAQFSQGVTTNVWKATDNSGLTATCAFTVTVSCGATSEQLAVRSEELAVPTTDNRQMLAMNLAPNPATTEVMISIEGLGETGGDITVFDAQGRMVWQQFNVMSPTASINVSEWPSGLYQVRLQTDHFVVTKSLVVARR